MHAAVDAIHDHVLPIGDLIDEPDRHDLTDNTRPASAAATISRGVGRNKAMTEATPRDHGLMASATKARPLTRRNL
jgi:hypothetical protein